MLGTLCVAACRVLVRNRLRTGTTIVLLPLFLDLMLRLGKVLKNERLVQMQPELQQLQREVLFSQPVSRMAG